MEVKQTTNYEQFILLKENREINKGALRLLELSIQEHNMLEHYPMLVTKKKEVIDGQHRLKAAEHLSLPIFYGTLDEAGLKEIILLNANVRNWQLKDYLHAYVMLGNRNYIKLEEFAIEYSISIHRAMMVLENNFTEPRIQRDRFKKGNFTIIDLNASEHFISFYMEVKKYCIDTCYMSRDFFKALSKVYDQLDQKQFLATCEKYHVRIDRQTSIKGYIHLFEDTILNFRKSKKIVRLI